MTPWFYGRCRPTIPVILITFAAVPGCGDDPPAETGPINPLDLIAVASDLSLLAAQGIQAHLLGVAGLPPLTASSPAPADTVLPGITCPAATVDTDGGGLFLRLDYGTGCISVLDGTCTSGAIRYDASRSSPTASGYRLSAFIDAFTRDGRRLNGDLEIVDNDDGTVGVESSFLTLFDGGKGSLFSGSLFALSSPLLGGPQCSGWRVLEGRTTFDINPVTYTVDVLDTLIVLECCAYPVAGRLSISAADLLPAVIDFGTGVCDDKASIVMGEEEVSFDLGYATESCAPVATRTVAGDRPPGKRDRN